MPKSQSKPQVVLNQPKVIVIDEFRDLFPAQTKEERKKLKDSIIREKKCRDKIIVWKTIHDGEEQNIILDGHNRHEICLETGMSYDIEEMHFDSAFEAKMWMIKNQYGRRNLSPFQRAEIALQFKDSIVEQAEKNRKAGVGLTSGKGVKTASELGKVAGVSRDAMNKIMYIFDHAPVEKIDNLRNGITGHTINGLYQELKKSEKKGKKKIGKKATGVNPTKKTRKIKLDSEEKRSKLREIVGNRLMEVLVELEEFNLTLQEIERKRIANLTAVIEKLIDKV